MTPEPNPTILDYIRTNRATYTREAIERELRASGHTQEAIDAAWDALPPAAGATLAPPPRAVASVRFWVLLVLVAAFAVILLPLLSVLVLAVMVSLAYSSTSNDMLDSGLVALLLLLAPFLLGYLAIGLGGWWLLRRDRIAAYGVFGGLVVAFALSVIIAGSCVVIIQQL